MTSEPIILKLIPTIAAYIKTAVGAPNNAAWLVCLDAHDKIKQHPAYKHEVKNAYKAAFDEFKAYERRLLHAEKNRLFRLSDLSKERRAMFGDISDRDYYDMWAGAGFSAYDQTHDIITSLWNKYRLSLIQHGVGNADLLAWPMAALCCLELAVKFYRAGIEGAEIEWKLPQRILTTIFGQLSLQPVAVAWRRALTMTNPAVMDYDLEEIEERNITLGIQQLEERWSSSDVIIGSTYLSVKEWRENFASKAKHKAAMRRILEIKQGFEG